MKSTSGNIIRDHNKQLEWWAEHFLDLYFRENLVCKDALDAIECEPELEDLDNEPSIEELYEALESRLPRVRKSTWKRRYRRRSPQVLQKDHHSYAYITIHHLISNI